MIVLLASAFLGLLASAKDCQYFVLPGSNTFPAGIDRCSYTVDGGIQISWMPTCLNEDVVQLTYYYAAFDCTGRNYVETFGHNNATFDCSSTKLTCGKAFGFKHPCGCSAAAGTCDVASAISVVDGFCLKVNGTFSVDWTITCGSISKAQGTVTRYGMSSSCSGESAGLTNKAGCQTGDFSASTNTNYTNLEFIICPGNMATLSITLLIGLIAAALAL